MAYVHADLRYTEKMGAGNPTVTAIVQGMIVYDWRDKQYKYSKNPVVCLYDYLTNKTYGAGRYVTPDMWQTIVTKKSHTMTHMVSQKQNQDINLIYV